MAQSNGSTRYHALDSLRASMMMLGIWLHTVVSYSREGGWPIKDPHPTHIYDWTLGLIHNFRMPVFFVMAGFFGALLWQKRGAWAFVRNRFSRIVLPFAVFWLAMYPAVMSLAAYVTISGSGRPHALRDAVGYVFLAGGWKNHLHPMHMWFLEYLILLYGLGFVGVKLIGLVPARYLEAANAAFRWALGSVFRPLIFAVPFYFGLMAMKGGFLEDPPNFVPVPKLVLIYLIPFAFGWLLYLNRDLLGTFNRLAWTQIAASLVLFVAYMVLVGPIDRRPDLWHIVKPIRAAVGSVALWFIVFGMTGLFLRYGSRESKLGRYLSDGSYWMYLVHMPVLMLIQLGLWKLAWPAELKVWVCLLLAIPVLVLSYDLLARNTRIGVLLNGRRYLRAILFKPRQEAAVAAEACASEGA